MKKKDKTRDFPSKGRIMSRQKSLNQEDHWVLGCLRDGDQNNKDSWVWRKKREKKETEWHYKLVFPVTDVGTIFPSNYDFNKQL